MSSEVMGNQCRFGTKWRKDDTKPLFHWLTSVPLDNFVPTFGSGNVCAVRHQ